METTILSGKWSGRADLNLSRFAGVSEAGARRRNPDPAQRERDPYGNDNLKWKLVGTGRFELEPFCGRERSGSPQAKSRSRAAGEGSLWKRQFEVENGRDGQI